MNKQKLIVIVGSTASGKTSLGIQIAKKFNGGIISADSRAIYREMNIGTAKPARSTIPSMEPVSSEFDESIVPIPGGAWSGFAGDSRSEPGMTNNDEYLVDGVRHYGFDLVNPDEHFQALDFKKFAEANINKIALRGKVPIVVGGTGLYISGLVDNFDFEGGVVGESKYDVLQIGLKVDRQILYDRIDHRVDEMIEQGLVDEVRALKEKYGCAVKSMTGIGYRQICEYLDGEVGIETAIENLKRDSRHYAKRQMTWFKRDNRIHWIEDAQDAIKLVTTFFAI
ncbi:tRNA (adenosine(37)-N6)-dimethylallyltransferase MiaA [Patescibacteria group bacterium]|nr:tRNA (adenosine(37)-N6)-dimethylallyltransferase MiaA [Patescibacteria group bacterium]MBU4452875.1 tRNA (adenosine(37)-N6)-dimethylallyltransferase MiaA [Patescibacteria group bacterium]